MPRRPEGRDLPEIVLRLFDEARASFPEPRAVNRALVELCRLYEPVSGGPIVDHALRRHIVESLQHNEIERAERALAARLEQYRESFHAVEARRREATGPIP
jgi:hypothetical protein